MSFPKISICTATFNRANLLMERAKNSVFKQTYTNWEWIIVDDGSIDNTEQVVMSFKDSRVKYKKLPTRNRSKEYKPTAENHWLAGPVRPYNEALKHVKGDWIARLDDDDIWPNNMHLEDMLNYAVKGNYEFVTALNLEEKDGRFIKAKCYPAHSTYYGYKENKESPLIGGTGTWLYQSKLKKYKYNRYCYKKKINRVNDIDLVIRLYKHGVRFGFYPKVELLTKPRPGEISTGHKAYIEKAKEKEKFYG